MPTLSEATSTDLSAYASAEPRSGAFPAPTIFSYQPNMNPMMRCPLPPIWQTTPDSLRQFYSSAQVPQTRLFNPPANGVSTIAVSKRDVTLVQSTASSSGTSGTATNTKAAQTALTTAVLNPGMMFKGVLDISKAFQLLSLASSTACRIELYGTKLAQNLDVGRALDTPPPAGVTQNIICDLVLDTNPYQWSFQNRTGNNGDAPVQQADIYVTVTNLGASSTAITVSVLYVPLES
jgi:hypothetical protein